MLLLPKACTAALADAHPGTAFEASSSGFVTSGEVEQRYLFKKAPMPALQIQAEAESLKLINSACPGLANHLLSYGQEGNDLFMLSAWHGELSHPLCFERHSDTVRKDMGRMTPQAQAELGKKLGQMHLASFSATFGFHVPTFCGATEQDNTPETSWKNFFSKRRVGDLIDRIGDAELLSLGQTLQERVIPELLDALKIKPALLHGDLWSGNAGLSKHTNRPIIFDPCSYYGHSEMELGITMMFGGFGDAFFNAYHDVVPKAEPVSRYDDRLQLYELYHHLNHVRCSARPRQAVADLTTDASLWSALCAVKS